MSLREKLQAEKSVKAESREQESASAKERENSLLKEELNELIRKRAAISEIKESVRTVTTEVHETKSALKTERNTIRALHKESIDEETGEASLPKTDMLVRGPEYQEEEEIVNYTAARDAFRLSTEKVREVRMQLSELGIENPEKLLPGQLEATLEQQEKDIDAETRAFIVEHQDIDPELTANIKEDLITSTAKRIAPAMDMAVLADARTANNAFLNSLEEKGTVEDSLKKGMAILESDTRAQKSIARGLVHAFERTDSFDELDVEAVERTLIRQVLTGFAGSGATGIAEVYYDSAASKGQEKDLDDTGVIEALIEKGVASGIARPLTDNFVKNYQAFSEYKRLHIEISDAKEALRVATSSHDIYKRNLDRAQEDSRYGRSRQFFEESERDAADLLKNLSALKAQQSTENFESLRVRHRETDGRLLVELPGTYRDLDTQNTEDSGHIATLAREIADIGRESDGILGLNKKSKSERIQAKSAEKSEKERLVASRKSTMQQIKSETEASERSLQGALGKSLGASKGIFTQGTVFELINALEVGSLQARVEAAKALEEYDRLAEHRNAEQQAMSEKIQDTGFNKSELDQKIQMLEQRRIDLQSILKNSGYLS